MSSNLLRDLILSSNIQDTLNLISIANQHYFYYLYGILQKLILNQFQT